jgi:hypothetical protein
MHQVIQAHQIVVLRCQVSNVPWETHKEVRLIFQSFDHLAVFVEALADRPCEVQLFANH